MSGDLFTVDELANQFNCNAETVREAFRSGELIGFKFAGDWFAVRNDFMACLAERAMDVRQMVNQTDILSNR